MIKNAAMTDFEAIRDITRRTINEIYPRYYPKGAVDFFLKHHSDESIRRDISQGLVYLLTDSEGIPEGTVTVKGNEILRLFVLPEAQGKGLGRQLLDFAEAAVFERYDEAVIDSSLAAKPIYLRRGYKETEYNLLPADNGDFLCFDIMKKPKGL